MGERRDVTALSLVQMWLPILFTVVGGLWAFYLFIDQQRVNNEQRVLQRESERIVREHAAWKPYIDRRVALLTEMSQVLGKVMTLEVNSDEWKVARRRYRELRWGEFTMVLLPDYAAGFIHLDAVMEKYSFSPNADTRKELEENCDAALYSMMQLFLLGHIMDKNQSIPPAVNSR